MKNNQKIVLFVLLLISFFFTPTFVFASQIVFTQEFHGGFDVSVNGASPTPSGSLTIWAMVDGATLDNNPDPSRGDFVIDRAFLTGAGFVNREIVTPLELHIWDGDNFAFQLLDQFNEGIAGWNGDTSAGQFMTDVNDLSTLTIPYTTTGTSTFWYQGLAGNAWTLDLGGDTIGADIGGNGADGTFSIAWARPVPVPSTILLFGFGLLSFAGVSRKSK